MKNFFTCICAAMLIGCGGEVPKPTIAIYGDSISATSPDLNSGFANELASILKVNTIDYACAGQSVRDVRQVDNGADIILIRYGGADALRYGSSVEELTKFRIALTELISTATKPVVLTGIIALAPYNQLVRYNYPLAVYKQKVIDLDIYHNEIESVAKQMNIPYINIREVSFYGINDLRDEVHPNQNYSSRLTKFIADKIQNLNLI